MRCPHCPDEPLVALEHQRVEVDYCAQCRGIWLNAGEIELIYGNAEAARDFLDSRNKVTRGEKPRHCPECGTRMTKEATEGTRPIIVDHCPRGHGLWFDHGELAAVLEHAPSQHEVARFLREIFPAKEPI